MRNPAQLFSEDQNLKVVFSTAPKLSSLDTFVKLMLLAPPFSIQKIAGVTLMLSVTYILYHPSQA